MVAWYNDYKQNGWKPKAVSKYSKYSAKQRRIAIDHYYKHGRCVSRTVRMLGYPSRTLLKEWLVQAHPEDFPDCSPNASLIKLTTEQKEQAVIDLCTRTGTAKEVAEKYGVDRGALYYWKRQLLSEGGRKQMADRNSAHISEAEQIDNLIKEVKTLTAEANELKQQVRRLRLEKDALQMAAELIKKGQGISLDTLSNREKTIVIGALRSRYSLKELLSIFKLSKSSYCYQQKVIATPDKYEHARELIRCAFSKNYECYGYRRIQSCVKKQDGSNYSEKVIRRLMQEEHLIVYQ